MDPLSITASCLTLVGTITKLSTTLIVFVKSVRGARSDLDTISRELHSLQTVLELLAEDASDSSKNHFPPTLQKQIEGIISNCGQVLAEIERTLEKYKGYGASKGARWAVSGSDDVTKLRISLEAHKSALEIALEMVAISITREVKADTGVLLNDTAAIKQDTAEILAEIARLRAQLPADSGDQHPNILLERYLDDLTSYAETVYSDEIGIFPESEGYEQTFIDARETPGSGAGPKSNNSTPHSRSPPRSTTPPMTDIPSLVVSEDTGRNEQIRRAGLPRKEVAQYTYQLPLREPLTRPERSPPTWAQGSSSKSTAASPSERITTSTTHQVIGDRRSDNDKRSLEIGEASGAAVASNVSSSKRRTQLSTSTGTWRLGKTIGGGPNAKVKLARNEETSEQVAVKIIPRLSLEEHTTAAAREVADHNKELRSARQIAMVSLIDHPYIVAVRDVCRTNYHWYALLEYYNGGTLLDYIISHGRLKEHQARKFSRQLISALDYCHANGVIHGRVSIHNILISKIGDIKIAGFGETNFFGRPLPPDMKTDRDLPYFQAPELFKDPKFASPELDIYALGVVMHMLACGKVPFDDTDSKRFYEKVENGQVEFPPWVSKDFRHLITGTLNPKPKARLTMAEIKKHPWITKGFQTPPKNYLPRRQPLTLPLNTEVIRRMTGFDFGPPEHILEQLTKTLDSQTYARMALNVLRAQRNPDRSSDEAPPQAKKSFLGFYSRRSPAREHLHEQGVVSMSDLCTISPLIPIYYLVWEKMEREALDARTGNAGSQDE